MQQSHQMTAAPLILALGSKKKEETGVTGIFFAPIDQGWVA